MISKLARDISNEVSPVLAACVNVDTAWMVHSV